MTTRILQMLFALSLLVSLSFPQAKSISTISQNAPADYRLVTFLEQGPTDWKKGYAFRVAVTTSEIYNNVYLEKMTFGEEGCCAKVVSVRQLNLKEFAKAFDLRGELSGFEFVNWVSAISFRFKMHNRVFEISQLQDNNVKIVQVK